MKKITLALIAIFLLAGCAPQAPAIDPSLIYTEAVKTVWFQMTMNAALTPSATVTPSPLPTETATLTLEPSPTSPPATPTWVAVKGKVSAPIYMYKYIASSKEDNPYYKHNNPYTVSPKEFRRQMQYLKDAGYTSVTVDQVVTALRDGAEMPTQPIVIVFEQIGQDVYNNAYPVMKEMGFKGTVYVVVKYLDGGGFMSTTQVKNLIQDGWAVGSNGWSGAELNPSNFSDEISVSRTDLETKLGVPIKTFLYPYGASSGAVIGRVMDWGYMGAVGLGRSIDLDYNVNLYYLPGNQIKKDLTLTDFVAQLPYAPLPVPTDIPTPTTTPTGAAAVPPAVTP